MLDQLSEKLKAILYLAVDLFVAWLIALLAGVLNPPLPPLIPGAEPSFAHLCRHHETALYLAGILAAGHAFGSANVSGPQVLRFLIALAKMLFDLFGPKVQK